MLNTLDYCVLVYLSVMEPGPHIGAICDTLLTLDGAADLLMCDKSYYHCKYYLFEGNKPLINLRSPQMPCGTTARPSVIILMCTANNGFLQLMRSTKEREK